MIMQVFPQKSIFNIQGMIIKQSFLQKSIFYLGGMVMQVFLLKSICNLQGDEYSIVSSKNYFQSSKGGYASVSSRKVFVTLGMIIQLLPQKSILDP